MTWTKTAPQGSLAGRPQAAGQSGGAEVVIDALIFPGGYQDQAGYEAITWRVEGSRRYKLPSLDFFTAIRGIDLRSTDFDSLEPADPSAAAGRLLAGPGHRGSPRDLPVRGIPAAHPRYRLSRLTQAAARPVPRPRPAASGMGSYRWCSVSSAAFSASDSAGRSKSSVTLSGRE